MQNTSLKKNLSSTQVLKTLQVLMEGEYTMQEIMSILNKKESNHVFNNSVISKYINTCRQCGISIPKINNKYYVAAMPFGLELSPDDINILEQIQMIAKKDMSSKSYNFFKAFTDKINMFSNRKITSADKANYNITIENFERAVSQKRRIKLMFKNKAVLECTPITVTKHGNKTIFVVFKKRIRNIDMSRISGLEVLSSKYIDIPEVNNQTVIFKLKGNLAKRYTARAHETVELNTDGTINVINKNEQKDELFSRLLRYDDKCEIISPKIYREEMKQIISDMLNNYGV